MFATNTYFTAMVPTTRTVMPVTPSIVERGALLQCTEGSHKGDTYVLVRETDRAFNKDATGKEFGTPKCLFNLVNLSTGKTRVSEPQRKLIWDGKRVPVAAINRHFGMNFRCIGNLTDVQPEVKAGVNRIEPQPQTITTWQQVQVMPQPVNMPVFGQMVCC